MINALNKSGFYWITGLKLGEKELGWKRMQETT